MARFATLYSGSSGNCAVCLQPAGGAAPSGGPDVRQEYLLVDMGKSCRQTVLALRQLGLEPEAAQGILVTHEHSDHVAGLQVFLKRYPVPVYGSAATLRTLAAQGLTPTAARLVPLDETPRAVGGFTVQAFATSHDAAGCCGFSIQCADGHRMSIATDLGCVSGAVYGSLRGSGLVALESNYDRVRLQMGPYPYYLKARIASQQGHLSNEECASVVADLLAEGCTRFALCHLSQENNTPELARATVQQRLAEDGRFTPLQLAAGALTLQVSPRSEPSPWLEF